MALYGNRQPIYVDGDNRQRRRIATIVLALIVAYLLFTDFARGMGIDVQGNILAALGIRSPVSTVGGVGPAGAEGRPGADGAPGADGFILNRNEAVIGLGACDTNVRVSLASRIERRTAVFALDTIRFSDVSEACRGLGLRLYLFSGNEGDYTLEATSAVVTVPSSPEFTLDYKTLNIGDVDSASLSKLAFEIAE